MIERTIFAKSEIQIAVSSKYTRPPIYIRRPSWGGNKKQYCDELVNNWVNQLNVLNDFATTHAAYIAYTKRFKSRFTYFLRTICDFDQFTKPIEDILKRILIPNLMGTDG